MLSDVNLAPPVELFQLQKDYQDDNAAQKINLGLGAYRTEEGLPWVLPVVRKVELRIAEMHKHEVQNTLPCFFIKSHHIIYLQDSAYEYVPFLGMSGFSSAAAALLLGPACPAMAEGRVLGVQVTSRTLLAI